MLCGNQDFIMPIGADWYRTIILHDEDDVAINITGASAVLQIRASATSETSLAEITSADNEITITGATGTLELYFSAAKILDIDTTGLKIKTISEGLDTLGNMMKDDGYAAYYALVLTYQDDTIERVIDGYMCLVPGGVV